MKVVIFLVLAFVFTSSAYAEPALVSALKLKLKHINARQAVVSQNIANSETPGYKALDIEPVDYNKFASKAGSRLQLRATSDKHISGMGGGVPFRTLKQRDTYETAPDGNNVVLEQQMLKMSQNDLEYRTTLGVMKKINNLKSIAIGDNR